VTRIPNTYAVAKCMMVDIVMSQEVLNYIKEKRIKRPNVIVYRDVNGIIMGYTTRKLKFVPKVKLADREPNELFVVKDNSYGFPIWVERGLLPALAKHSSVSITLKKSFKKGLELQLGQDLAGSTSL
jgi:hypothetical protein